MAAAVSVFTRQRGPTIPTELFVSICSIRVQLLLGWNQLVLIGYQSIRPSPFFPPHASLLLLLLLLLTFPTGRMHIIANKSSDPRRVSELSNLANRIGSNQLQTSPIFRSRSSTADSDRIIHPESASISPAPGLDQTELHDKSGRIGRDNQTDWWLLTETTTTTTKTTKTQRKLEIFTLCFIRASRREPAPTERIQCSKSDPSEAIHKRHTFQNNNQQILSICLRIDKSATTTATTATRKKRKNEE